MLEPIRLWIEEVATRLLEGERLLLQLPPRMGKTYLANQVVAALGKTACMVEGSAFAESDQHSQRIALGERITETVGRYGSAQLIFDSYHLALGRSQGPRLQTWLSSKLVDSETGRDVGALFTARCGATIHRRGAGSPLMSRVDPIAPPKLGSLANLPPEALDAQRWSGDSALLAQWSLMTGAFDPVHVADKLELDASYIADVRSVAQFQINSLPVELDSLSYKVRCAVSGLLTTDGPTLLFKRLESLLTGNSDEESAGWPEAWEPSVDRFSRLIAGADRVLWVDRYMYRDPQPLRKFLNDVVHRVDCKIDLLGSPRVSDRDVSPAEMYMVNSIPQVEARFIPEADRKSLHDRHLIVGNGGFTMPQVHVLVGRQLPGSAVAAPTTKFGVDYDEIWKRAHLTR